MEAPIGRDGMFRETSPLFTNRTRLIKQPGAHADSCSSTSRFILFVRQSYPTTAPAFEISFLLEKSAILLPQTDHGSGRRHGRQGRNDSHPGICVAG